LAAEAGRTRAQKKVRKKIETEKFGDRKILRLKEILGSEVGIVVSSFTIL
jgi:hypothetical protein